MKRKGFTLIELLVVIVIIGILVAIALPNFIKIKDKAREAEIKQNLHAIQLAIERYATDQDGNYPFFLYGGDSLFNIGTSAAYNSSPGGYIGFTSNIYNPFDIKNWDWDNDWDYSDSTWNELLDPPADMINGFGDAISFEGYMPKYPRNPFQTNANARKFSADAANLIQNRFQGYGGKDGTLMFNIGWWGEAPQIMTLGDNADSTKTAIMNHMPGNFYYHPRWSDGVTNFGHVYYQYNHTEPIGSRVGYPAGQTMPPQDDEDDVSSLDVNGYDLVALGSTLTKGMDMDVSILIAGFHAWRTGYLTQGGERNPWVGPDGGSSYVPTVPDPTYDGTKDNFEERPYSDDVVDFYIIHLGSGLDQKLGGSDFTRGG